MKCPRCDLPGRKAFKGYCTKVHRDLDNKARVVVLECAVCGVPVSRLSSQTKGKVFCVRCPKNSGETHPRWKEGQYINPAGYRLIMVKGAYLLEHRHTWEQANNACILPTSHGKLSIHHINMNKLDNRPENLVMLTNEVHGRIHRLIDSGRFKEAKRILIEECAHQAFWALNSEHLQAVKAVSLEDLLIKGNNGQ